MLFGLGKLFGAKAKTEEPVPTPTETTAGNRTTGSRAYVRRDAVFDRERRLAGHVFRLQHVDAGIGDAAAAIPPERRLLIDRALVGSLAASAREEGWGKTLAFIPLGTAILGESALDALPSANTVLLLQVDAGADPANLAPRLGELKARGFRIGVFRQPAHPAYAAVLQEAESAAIDVAASQGGNVRDFSVAIRSNDAHRPLSLFAANIETHDDFDLCRQWHFDYFHGDFAARQAAGPAEPKNAGDPHKLNLLHLLNLVQGEADTTEIANALKQDPLLTYRILRYLNSAAIGLSRPVSGIDQALMLIGRQRLARWLSVLLFSVKDPDFADWLLVESSLGRGRVMELLGAQRFPAAEGDHLFLTGVFSRLDRLLHMPLAEALQTMPLPAHIRNALLERSGPYAPLLEVAEACEAFDPQRIEASALAAGLDPETVNRALLEATAWTSEVTESWE